MTREEFRSAHRSARLRRRQGPATALDADDVLRGAGPHIRHKAAWALTAVALFAAAIAVGRIAPSEQHGRSLAVSVPAASTPAAAEAPVPS